MNLNRRNRGLAFKIVREAGIDIVGWLIAASLL